MKKITVLLLLVISISSCKKDCSGDNPLDWGRYLEIKKTSEGIWIKNKYIYPVVISQISCIVTNGGNNGIPHCNVKILSGFSHTFKFSEFKSSVPISTSYVNGTYGEFSRDLCDYKNRNTPWGSFSGDRFGVRF